jgi:hypothetical protein
MERRGYTYVCCRRRRRLNWFTVSSRPTLILGFAFAPQLLLKAHVNRSVDEQKP